MERDGALQVGNQGPDERDFLLTEGPLSWTPDRANHARDGSLSPNDAEEPVALLLGCDPIVVELAAQCDRVWTHLRADTNVSRAQTAIAMCQIDIPVSVVVFVRALKGSVDPDVRGNVHLLRAQVLRKKIGGRRVQRSSKLFQKHW